MPHDFDRAEAYAHDIIGDLNAGAEGWTDWNIVLDQTGGPNHLGNNCDAPIIADTVNQTLLFQPTYYALGRSFSPISFTLTNVGVLLQYIGHFSRFLPPGAIRVGVTVVGNPQQEVTSFIRPSDGVIVVIAINRWHEESSFKLVVPSSTSVGKYQYARIVLPPHSFVTLEL
jgi:glucosylceramidase